MGPLFDLLATAPAEDTHLTHTVRMSLRDQLRDPAVIAELRQRNLPADQRRTLAGMAISVTGAASAELVLDYLDEFDESGPELAAQLEFVAENMDPRSFDKLAHVVRKRLADDLTAQSQRLLSIHTGLERRQATDQPQMVAWAKELAGKLLARPADDSPGWTSSRLPGAAAPGDPWVRQRRNSSDGVQGAVFWSSLPHGERLTGVLRSGPFEIPGELRFFMAGHNGPLGAPETPRNVIRLRDAETGRVLAESRPPRNDVAQPFVWKLPESQGRRGLIEIVDGFDATGYAWLAVGRFSIESLNPDRVSGHAAAIELISRFRLKELRPQLTAIVRSPESSPDRQRAFRRAAAAALVSFDPDARLAALLVVTRDDLGVTAANREAIYREVLNRNPKRLEQLLAEAMARAPRQSQRTLAETLASGRQGAETLLALVAAGKASPRLLQDAALRGRLAAPQDYQSRRPPE